MADTPQPTSRRALWWSLLILTLAIVAVPFLAVTIPPSTDLPQHIAQVRLLFATIGNAHSRYVIHWYTPYLLVYVFIAPIWKLVAPINAARFSLMAIGWLWVAAVFVLARTRRRSPEVAILASLFFFNICTYWGFINYVFGFPVFIGWWLLTTDVEGAKPASLRSSAWLLLGAAALYFSHALWFALGLSWLALDTVVFRRTWRRAGFRALGVLPVVALALWWYPVINASGFKSKVLWTNIPLARLNPLWWANAALGGLGNWIEYVVFGVAVLWAIAGLWSHRHDLRDSADLELLSAAVVMILLTLFLPNFMQNTLIFASRWASGAVVLLVLAVPRPKVKAAVACGVILVVSAAFCVVTTAKWRAFERVDLSGFRAAINHVAPDSRVIGLSFRKKSRVIEGSTVYPWRPFIQFFAYAQVVHGGTLNSSFTIAGPAPVHFRNPLTQAKWTMNLAWFPQNVRSRDFRYFDYALINGTKAEQATALKLPELKPVTHTGYWRLYRVVHPVARH